MILQNDYNLMALYHLFLETYNVIFLINKKVTTNFLRFPIRIKTQLPYLVVIVLFVLVLMSYKILNQPLILTYMFVKCNLHTPSTIIIKLILNL